MTETPRNHWNPRAPEVLEDQIAAYDAMRRRCPVAHSDYLHWSVFRHVDVMRVLEDHETFSNVVSRHPSVPNGMDPPEHTPFRRLIEPYFGEEVMSAFEPACRSIARQLAAALPSGGEVEFMAGFAHPFALRVQCAFMGWPESLHAPLQSWIRRNRQATLDGDRDALGELAQEFEAHVHRLLAERRAAGAHAPDDLTTRLLHERIEGRPLTDEEIASIVRNWTVGELGTIAASVGILAHYLAVHPEVQGRMREEPVLLPAAIDEILRIHAPLVANRRVTTRPVEIGGRQLAAGEVLSIVWASANRDEAVFGDPDAFRPDRDPALNLLYGAGIHVCPGAPLARLELRLVTEALLGQTRAIGLAPGKPPVKAVYPGSGYSALFLRID